MEGMSIVQSTSLIATGTPASGSERSARGAAAGRSRRRASSASGRVDVQEGVHVAVDRGDAVEVRAGRLDAGHLAGGEQLGEVGRGQAGQVVVTAPPPGSR